MSAKSELDVVQKQHYNTHHGYQMRIDIAKSELPEETDEPKITHFNLRPEKKTAENPVIIIKIAVPKSG